ncbi:hypothetical protein KZZ52_24100 [Dactylosporangium sp. AC04546]|uniref:hypothetical protein n=1 Tax=Dactylosporangium sp. AC04546 TaxID=2862460 RepID=UPI001EDF2B8C|nr:hypothetical protein [Dactylosporangium sp. AC04546]WVK88359.1 hypothetical protein KZZ52_24100 [Dactylosporangium sp. AC04546]
MAFFRKTEPNDELAELRLSVQQRGQAKIPEAAAYVEQYLQVIAAEAGVSADNAGRAWLRDRLRMFMVVGWASWFQVLDRIPEGQQLRGEWVQLTLDATRFGPEHLVAWWWLVSEPLFRPLVANQLTEMRGALTDGALAIRRQGNRFEDEMVDWKSFFN